MTNFLASCGFFLLIAATLAVFFPEQYSQYVKPQIEQLEKWQPPPAADPKPSDRQEVPQPASDRFKSPDYPTTNG